MTTFAWKIILLRIINIWLWLKMKKKCSDIIHYYCINNKGYNLDNNYDIWYMMNDI